MFKRLLIRYPRHRVCPKPKYIVKNGTYQLNKEWDGDKIRNINDLENEIRTIKLSIKEDHWWLFK